MSLFRIRTQSHGEILPLCTQHAWILRRPLVHTMHYNHSWLPNPRHPWVPLLPGLSNPTNKHTSHLTIQGGTNPWDSLSTPQKLSLILCNPPVCSYPPNSTRPEPRPRSIISYSTSLPSKWFCTHNHPKEHSNQHHRKMNIFFLHLLYLFSIEDLSIDRIKVSAKLLDHFKAYEVIKATPINFFHYNRNNISV